MAIFYQSRGDLPTGLPPHGCWRQHARRATPLRALQMARRNKCVYNFSPCAIPCPCRRGESERVVTLVVEQFPEIYLCRFETCALPMWGLSTILRSSLTSTSTSSLGQTV